MPYYRCPGCGVTTHSAAAYSAESICPNCSAVLPDDATLFPAAGVARDVTQVLATEPAAPAQARRAVVGLPLGDTTRAKLELVVSELVSNAVLHTGCPESDPVTLQIRSNGSRVLVAVHDRGPGFVPPPAEGPGPDQSGGRGCMIVASLSEAWGVEHDDHGCMVWCELAIDGKRAA